MNWSKVLWMLAAAGLLAGTAAVAQTMEGQAVKGFRLPEYDAEVLTAKKALSDFFEESVALIDEPKMISNWLMVEIPPLLKEHELTAEEIPFTPASLAELIGLIQDGTISGKIAKSVLADMFEAPEKAPKTIVDEKGLAQMNDSGELEAIIEKIVDENPKSVEDIAGGNKKAYGFLTGQVMKATKGKANPQEANKIIREKVQAKIDS